MFQKKFKDDFPSQARTLDPEEVLKDHDEETGRYMRTHEDGWTITGEIKEDYCYWVNDFGAVHPIFGKVWGNFERTVYADTEAGFNDFYLKHPPREWDYWDI